MRIFDDFHETKGDFDTKNERIDALINVLNSLNEDNKIKDIMVIARTTETELGPKGLPHDMMSAVTVDTEYEANVFMRFATDILFEKTREIAVKEFLRRTL